MSNKKPAGLSYFEQRMKELGVAPPYSSSFTDPNGREATTTFFSENEQGDILIKYLRPDGMPYLYTTEGATWPQPFMRTRLRQPLGKMKYRSPKGQGMLPYFPENTIRKYKAGMAIDTLFLIEGEFKAFKTSLEGMDCVGMGSIHGFYGQGGEVDGSKRIHPDILKLLERCQVKRLCLLLDADTPVISYEPKKDLWTRQNSFFKAVVNFYKVASYTVARDNYAMESLHFGHIHEKHVKEYKGMDDLLAGMKAKVPAIREELLLLEGGAALYFMIMKLGPNYYTELQRYFAIDSVDAFFKKYQDQIGPWEFVYKNAIYVQDGDGDRCRFVFHKDVEKYFRIGKDWMTVVKVPNERGQLEEEIKSFSIGEIMRDYPAKRYPGFTERIARYDAYCNIPEWGGAYKRIHEGCYNITNPIAHTPAAGEFPTTMAFLKHLFSGAGSLSIKGGGEASLAPRKSKDGKEVERDYDMGGGFVITERALVNDQFTVALDWLTIFHQQPTHRLPVPILVSQEFGTGKSTFLFWLQWTYGTNVAILNNEQFKMPFNSHYITKNIIGLDEGFLDVDKKAEKERLKQLVTAKKQYLQYKGVDMQAFNYFGKVVICSNDAQDVMKMDEAENRWFVVKVPPLPAAAGDPDFDEKLQLEIPAWLAFLAKRQIAHPRKTRLWFNEEAFITDQFHEIVKNTKTRVEKNLDELMKELFLTYKESRLDLPRKWIVEQLNGLSKYKIDQQEVKRYLDDKLGHEYHGTARIQVPMGWNEGGGGEYSVRWEKVLSRHYQLRVEDWLTQEEITARDQNRSIVDGAQGIGEALGILSESAPPF
jgi:hypothetical protein